MKPYYEHGGITLFHGDCREVLPRIGCVSLTITDPPYGIEFRSNYRTVRHDAITGDDRLDVETIKDLVNRSTHAAYVFCRWDGLADLPKPRSVMAWVKNNWSMGDLEHEHGRQWEAIAFYPKTLHKFVKRIPDVVFADRTGNELHPTQKPVSLIKQLIAANEGDVIFDPFCGSGTTLIAAKDLGRLGFGIEINERFCEIAAKRLSQEVFQW